MREFPQAPRVPGEIDPIRGEWSGDTTLISNVAGWANGCCVPGWFSPDVYFISTIFLVAVKSPAFIRQK